MYLQNNLSKKYILQVSECKEWSMRFYILVIKKALSIDDLHDNEWWKNEESKCLMIYQNIERIWFHCQKNLFKFYYLLAGKYVEIPLVFHQMTVKSVKWDSMTQL